MNRFMILPVVLLVSSAAVAGPVVSVKLTTNALGLGTADLNDGSTVDPDFAGRFITSPVLGQGSILYVQRNGLAGQNDLLATITARTHLDTTVYPGNWQTPNDYQAGVIYLSREETSTPDGRDEGLGVRAFTVTVNNTQPTRTFSGGLAKIEGSKEVSGGTGPTAYDLAAPNGAPHVDEDVLFTFAPQSLVHAGSFRLQLSKFTTTDKVELTVNLAGGVSKSGLFGTGDAGFMTPGSDVWNLNFGAIAGLGLTAGDIATSVVVRAVDPNPASPRGTAEHFLITGFTAEIIPAPGTAALLALGGLTLARRRR